MAKGFTYFCTDQHGHTYNRYSAGHTGAVYVSATIQRSIHRPASTPVDKHHISYSSRAGAGKAWPGGYTTETVRVRAYPGRHTAEPQS